MSWRGGPVSGLVRPLIQGALLVHALVACDRAIEEAPRDAPLAEPKNLERAQPTVESRSAPAPSPEPACPPGLLPIPGGAVWIGSAQRTFEGEENPQFLTRLPAFCADETEVTAAVYGQCVSAGACATPVAPSKRCTFGRPDRQSHPINCIDFSEAAAVCRYRGLRLPTEVEWEYLARGGSEQRKYPWGDASPEGRTCWKHPETCAVKSFEAGAFGLHDVTGNVWEWTSSWFGPYPFPVQGGRHRVIRGGSWSRRFDKWMKPSLRNRAAPEERGSHLGVRCVASQAHAPCPYGASPAGECLAGVDDAKCDEPLRWNGLRCARAGEPDCPAGRHALSGYGCVLDAASARVGTAATSGPGPGGSPSPAVAGLNLSLVHRARSPAFDADCRENQPTRPLAYRYEGGEHLARNQVGKRDGCKNRDVGVGWNSACCPR